jgi:hypothetical protein
MSTLQPIMAIDMPQSMSGENILSDLLDRIAERLILTNSLRAVDCYRSYSAKVVIDLQLDDIDSMDAHAELQVGSIDPEMPSQRVVLDTPGGRAEQVQVQPDSLERAIDQSGILPPKEKRGYVSRIRGRR